ncbi:MAG: 30S ribosomal protein S5 [Candidatus Gracilibacteria bacterium]|jgi:small subunit ribosomal protein S5
MAKPPFNRKGQAPMREVKEFEEEVIQIDRVTRVVKGGRRLRFRATVVIGNRKGKVGVGIGKSTEVQGAIKKAIAQAKKSLIEVPMIGQTIPHRVEMKFKSAKLIIMPARPGTGIIAGGPLRKVIELSGVKDILSKCLGAKNRLNNSQAAINALAELRTMPWLKKKVATPVAVAPGAHVAPVAHAVPGTHVNTAAHTTPAHAAPVARTAPVAHTTPAHAAPTTHHAPAPAAHPAPKAPVADPAKKTQE